nr:hypothetical protein [Tanacetum cinerariifolium]
APAAGGQRVLVQGEAPHLVEGDVFHARFGPVGVVAVGAAHDALELGAGVVVGEGIAPPQVQHLGALGGGPYPIVPVVGIGKAAAGPAQIGHVDFLERVHNIHTDAALLGHVQAGLDPKAAVDAAP